MRRFQTVLPALIAALALSGGDASADSCSQPGRIGSVCREMKHMNNQLNLLDAQRDLLRRDYSQLEVLSEGLEQSVNRLLINHSFEEHIPELNQFRSDLYQLKQLASRSHPSAFKRANSLRLHCNRCHAQHRPGSDWEKSDWSAIIKRCNGAGRNPLVCKHMFALAGGIHYFESSRNAGAMDFGVAEKVTEEMGRVTDVLIALGPFVHEEGLKALQTLKTQVAELNNLTRSRNPRAFIRYREIGNSCRKCHGIP